MVLCTKYKLLTKQDSTVIKGTDPIFNGTEWISFFAGTHDFMDSQTMKREIIESFWIEVLQKVMHQIHEDENTLKKDLDQGSKFDLVDQDTRTIKVPKSIFVNNYKHSVYALLEQHRGETKKEVLEELQRQIEELTLNFSEESLFKTCPNIMLMITKTDLPNAKEFLRGEYYTDKGGRMRILEQKSLKREGPSVEEKKELLPVLSEYDRSLLKEFGEHTIECLLVHTLSYLFNLENSVSLASLIDRIESNVRQHALFLRNNRICQKEDVEKQDVYSKAKTKSYPFGTALVEFLESRGLLRFTKHHSDEIYISESSEGIPKTFVKRVNKKNQSYYRSSFNYAECMFNTALLPIKLNLPMVFPPKDWEVHRPEADRVWLTISDIYGGYLSNPTGQIYSSQRIMSSPDPKSFFVYFGQARSKSSFEKAKKLCTAITGLQRTAFHINTTLLDEIRENRALFEEKGFLMPAFLTNIILPNACGILRTTYDKDEYKEIRSIYRYSELVTILMKNMQRARYECTIIDLAEAYRGYSIYFPAFLDFRGRIYRSGIFHFHERDLARSLLLFDKTESKFGSEKNGGRLAMRYLIATEFLYSSHPSEKNLPEIMLSYAERKNQILDPYLRLQNIVIDAQDAKRQFQFLSNTLLLIKDSQNYMEVFKTVPVTQDASASAYQLMSYFLLDEELAFQTNLFNTNGMINDIYSHIRVDLIQYLKDSIRFENPQLCNILNRVITRSIVKKIFMPIIYGKTVNSTTKDLIISLGQDVLPKECVKLSTLCFKFWKDRYSGMNSFIELIRLVGRVCASLERPVVYSTPLFNTSQDYKKMESCSVRVFDSKERRRRSVTLTFPSNVRDKMKSRASTFVNFIHQKDAQIAIEVASLANELNIPLYTVHDNFISNTECCQNMPVLYRAAIKKMDAPLTLINRFIYANLIEPALDNVDIKKKYSYLRSDFYDKKIIPTSLLNDFLSITPPSEAKNKSGWKKITEQLKSQYKLYCKTVCGPEKTFPEHNARFERFRSQIVGEYCIHH